MEIKTLIEHVSTFAEKQFKHTGHISRMYHAIDADGKHGIIAAPGDKNAVVAAVKKLFKEKNVVAYVMLDEAWMLDSKSMSSKEEVEKAKKEYVEQHKSIEFHPKRIEAVIITGEDKNGQYIAYREIIRPEKGKAHLGPLTWMIEPTTAKKGHVEGRMLGLLPNEGTRQ